MCETPQKFYVTTPIYYVNARPHIGHAYTTIVADVLARRHRLQGDETIFLTGTDEHGQKIERSAAAAGIEPQKFADEVSASFASLWKRMGVTHDRFIRTTDPAHKRGVQKLFADLYDRGFIYLSAYTGQYSVGEEMFVEGPPGTIGPDGKPTETVTEENFFFKLSEFQRPLLNLIETGVLAIEPEGRRNEVLSFLRGNVAELQAEQKQIDAFPDAHAAEVRREAEAPNAVLQYSDLGNAYIPGALKDLSVSRSSFTWGIPVPERILDASKATGKHIVYVWLDALANYMTAVGYGSDAPADEAEFRKFWPADLHLVGKEIIRFHCVYWPAFLLAAGLPLPKKITANGWLLFDNAKMSKSRGNVVRTETILEAFGDHVYGKQFPESTREERDLFASDVLRYFLLREIPFGQDGSFTFEALITRYNADLANGYGNLVSRTLAMIQKSFNAIISEEPPKQTLDELLKDLEDFQPKYDSSVTRSLMMIMPSLTEELLSNLDFFSALKTVGSMVSSADLALSALTPWKIDSSTSDGELKLAQVLYVTAESIRIITALLYPILPFATARVWAQLGLGDIEEAAREGRLKDLQWGGLLPGTKLGPLSPIFPRADKGLAQIMTDMEEQKNASRPDAPLKAAATPAVAAPIPSASTDPGAPARALDPLDEPSGMLPVAGSSATTTGPDGTPSHAAAQASGVFAQQPASAPATNPATAAPITIDDFAKIELRVAQIVVCERIPKADKLLRLEVDLGPEHGRRQILSGIAEWYKPEDLLGRRIVVITNLAPRKMRGLESHGMLLAASDGDNGKPVLATFGEDIALGSRLK